MPEETKQPVPQQLPRLKHEEFMKDPYFGKWYPKWINNAMENYPVIRSEFEKKDRCMSRLPRPMNRPCMILGAGVSLDKAAPLLKEWKHPIFSPASLAFIPLRWGRKPEYICAFDSLWNITSQLQLENKKTSWEGTTLLTHPNAEPKMIKSWRWDKYYYRRVFPGHEFFEFTFPLMYPWIKIGLRFSGSVINNALTIASFLGFSTIFLVGVDLGWKDDDNSRSDNWKKDKDDWVLDRTPKIPQQYRKTFLTVKGGVRSQESFIGFKSGLLSIYSSSKNNMEIVDCSDGMINEFPKADIETVIKEQGWGDYKTDKKIIDSKIAEYFNEVNADKYVIKKAEK
jgi:hypothetical protein